MRAQEDKFEDYEFGFDMPRKAYKNVDNITYGTLLLCLIIRLLLSDDGGKY